MISNLFNNLNVVDMWIIGSKALTAQLCLFPSSVIFSLTNDSMLIFIYNFHLSEIMASSGCCQMLLMNERGALKTAMQRCSLEPHPPHIHQRLLMLMDGCIFMSSTCLQTHSIMWQWSSGGFDLYLVRVLPPSISSSSNHRCHLGCRLPARCSV